MQRGTDDIDPDSAIVPVDELAAQALEVQAEDMALEDTLYALQKAFQGGHLDAITYLRHVRVPNIIIMGLDVSERVISTYWKRVQSVFPFQAWSDAANTCNRSSAKRHVVPPSGQMSCWRVLTLFMQGC